MKYDVVIRGGTVYDGRGRQPREADVGIVGDQIVEIDEETLPISPETKVIDAKGKWVMPGFVDMHTHYDAEIELAPSLSESLRHGVTTVVLGSCSLSLAIGTPEDLADMFCRVEAIPYEVVRPLLEEKKDWKGLGDYLEHLEKLPLGPNVASFVGHSAVRAHVLGIDRSLDPKLKPSEKELRAMEGIVREGLDLGYLGVSIQTLPWDKMGGDRWFRSRPLPSTFAHWSEYRRFARMLRERGRVFQGVPNITTKVNIFLFMLESIGLVRPKLKTTVISMMDTRASRGIHRFAGLLARAANTLLDADFKWQALPEVFDLWADGIDLVVFEEFGAGAAALHLQDELARANLLRDPEYREKFRAQWTSKLLPKIFHRDFNHSEILEAPDPSLVGKSFTELARERNQHVVDTFLDLVAVHGQKMRWYTVMANERRDELEWIVAHPDVLIGFSDAGAHLRNMAHYNFPLRMLRLVHEANKRGEPIMSVERAVHRLTGEIGEWFGIDAGVFARGRRADIAVIDPEGLDDSVERATEEEMPGFRGFRRLVRRNDGAVTAVLVGGKTLVERGQPLPLSGRAGRILRAN
ncbi:MAG: N-acyl-D-amino-acid deacylase family protein [Polyangiales bacterium]